MIQKLALSVGNVPQDQGFVLSYFRADGQGSVDLGRQGRDKWRWTMVTELVSSLTFVQNHSLRAAMWA